MAYAARTAVTGTVIPLEFVKLIDLPTLPGRQYSVDTPYFFAGWSLEGGSSTGPDMQLSNGPALWTTAYDSAIPLFTGLLAMGVAHADYAIREAGTGAADDRSNYFEKQGYSDGLTAGMNFLLTPAGPGVYTPTVSIEFQRQVLGDFTGGTASIVAADAFETQNIVFEDYLSTFVPRPFTAFSSTTSAPAGLFIFRPGYGANPGTGAPSTEAQDRFGGLKVGATGAITVRGLYKGDVATNPEQGSAMPFAQCRDDTYHYFLRLGLFGAGGIATILGFTRCTEGNWLSFSYNNYTPKFSDPDLPAYLAQMFCNSSATFGADPLYDPNYQFIACYGTDVGFLISYLKLNVDVWEPKFILVDKAWTTVQHITATAGDTTATTILAQGVRDTNDPPPSERSTYGSNAISMMMDSGYAWLIGGTPAVPLIVESSGGPAPTPVEPTDNTLTIRCWPFSLDDHDFGVFRLGPSATLVFDLKTRQWSEWQSPNRTNWRAHIGTNWVGMADTLGNYATDVVAGDDVTGVLWILDPTAGVDDNTSTGSLPFTRMVIGGIALDGRDTAPCGAVQLTASLGNPSLTGASITLRTSDDLGHTYTSHGSRTIVAGQFDQVLEWRALGLMHQPGRIFEISDDGVARIGRLSLR